MQPLLAGPVQDQAAFCTYCQHPIVEPKGWWQRFNQPTKEKVHALACGHKFHLPCVQMGVNEQIKLGLAKEGAATCPNCRAVTDLSSSTVKIKGILQTTVKVIVYAAALFGMVLTAYIAILLGIHPDLIVPLAGASTLLTYLALNKMYEHGLSDAILRACVGLHNWRSGLDLKIEDLNPTEIAHNKESEEQVRKGYWIAVWKNIIANWNDRGLKEFFDLNTNVSADEQATLLANAYDKLRTDDPGTFAALQNNALRSDAWLSAFSESADQLVELGLLIKREPVG